MSQFLLLPSLLVIAAALAARWWFAARVWKECGDAARQEGDLRHAEVLVKWKDGDPKAAAARAGALRFGMAAPPLSAVIAIFAVIVGKIPMGGAIALCAAITAVACVFGVLSLPAELTAIQRFRKGKAMGEKEYLCVQATAWNRSLPPALRTIFK